MKNRVWVKSPRAGLGNKVLVWANALVYSKVNNLEMLTTKWVSVFIGPILRGERSFRFYSGYFKEDNLFEKIKLTVTSLWKKKSYNPQNNETLVNGPIIVFNEVKFWMHFFDNIREHRAFVRNKFFNTLLNKEYQTVYKKLPAPKVGVHIRMGDFRNNQSSGEENFNWDKSVLERTPLDYFITVIQELRNLAGNNIEVHVFSDGSDDELEAVLELKNVVRSTNEKDIEDLLQLSKSNVIVTSASSTFSLLAGYLSDAILLHHPNFYMRPIREEKFNNDHYEGPFKKFDEVDDKVKTQIKRRLTSS